MAGRRWTRVDSLFAQGPDAEVYIVREDADGSSWVQFGDGGGFGTGSRAASTTSRRGCGPAPARAAR